MTSLHADEAYLEFYGFSHDPFAARVPGFKFFPAQRKPVLGQLHHLARYSQLLLVVSAPQGAGKTLLRQALVASSNKQAVHALVISARGAADEYGLLRQVAQGVQIEGGDLHAIMAQIAQLSMTGQEVYLLVDDAELLSDEAINALLLLAAGNADGRAHVFLFAGPELLPRLDELARGDECFHIIELQPYELDETREYLGQRLEGAGQGLELLGEEQIEAIHERSGGWPGAINQVAREVLGEAMLAQRARAGRAGGGLKLPGKHMLAAAVVVLGVVAAFFMQGQPGSSSSDPALAVLPLGAPAAEPVEVPVAPAVEFAGNAKPVPLPLVGEAQPVMREPLALAASGADEQLAEVAPLAGSAAPEPVQPVAPVAAPVAAPVVAAPAPVVATAPVKVAPAVVAPAKPAPAPASPAPAPVVTPKAMPAPAVASGGNWYAAQAGSRYTLQILGTRSESSARAFVREQGSEYHYFKKQHQGQPLYVVTYGSFATRDQAQAALRRLPAKVQAGKPWPRTLASIQQEML